MRPSRPGWLPELPEYLLPVSLIADGVYGKVLRAEDTRRGRTVAVRVLAEAGSGPSKASRLEAANRISTLDHPHIASIFEVDTFGDSSYIELELVEGASLARRLHQQSALAYPEVVRMGRQIAAALHVAHSVGVVHGDLNPENVLFTDAGDPKVIDFRFISGERSSYVPERSIEPPQYLSPEYIFDAPLDAASDVYSLGAILHQALSGRLPFDSIADPIADTDAVPSRSRLRTLPDPPAGLPAIPPALSEVVLKCVAKRADARFASAEELFVALEGLDHLPKPVAPPAPSEGSATAGPRRSVVTHVAPKPPASSRGRRLGIAALATVGIAAAAAGGFMLKRPPAQLAVGARVATPAARVSREVVVSVVSEPAGALVYFRGGAVLGRTPADLRLPRSRAPRDLVVRFPDGEERALHITPNRAATMLVHANRAPAPEAE